MNEGVGPSRAQEAHDGAQDKAHEPISEIESRIIEICSESPKSTPELLQALGYKNRTGNFKRAVSHLLEMDLLEMTIPTKPRSKKQKYRLTENGQEMLDRTKGNTE